MTLKKFFRNGNGIIMLLIVFLAAAILFRTSNTEALDNSMNDDPVFKEISMERYEEALNKEIEADVKIEEVKEILTDSQYCAVEISRSAEIKSICFTYHGMGIAKKDGNNYSILASTAVDQFYTTEKGIVFEPGIIESQNLSDGTMRISSHGKLTVDKKTVEGGTPGSLRDYEYRPESNEFFPWI